MTAIRCGLTSDEVAWVEEVLSNNENSDDAKLIREFIRGGLTKGQAEAVLHHRGNYLSTIHVKVSGPLHLRLRRL